jgi:NAD-dependent deacetylase
MQKAEAAAGGCDVYLVIGTSGTVHPAAELPTAARRAGAFVVEINPEPTPLTDFVHLSLRGRASAVLASLLEALS